MYIFLAILSKLNPYQKSNLKSLTNYKEMITTLETRFIVHTHSIIINESAIQVSYFVSQQRKEIILLFFNFF